MAHSPSDSTARRIDGSIDMDYYKARALAARRKAIAAAFSKLLSPRTRAKPGRAQPTIGACVPA